MTDAVRSITILGATGSVGQSTLDLIARNREAFDVLAVTARSDVTGLAAAARRVGARRAVIADESRHDELRTALEGSGVEAAAPERARTGRWPRSSAAPACGR